MKKHFVTFLSPGTFVSERTTKEISSWDVNQALEMSKNIVERYGATPYCFYFTTRERLSEDFNSREIERSAPHFFGGKVETIEEIMERNDPSEEILRQNMVDNKYHRVWRATKGCACAIPMKSDAVFLG